MKTAKLTLSVFLLVYSTTLLDGTCFFIIYQIILKFLKTEPFDLIKPNIVLPEIKIVPEGYSSLTMPCYAEGIPVPSITWESLDVSKNHNIKYLLKLSLVCAVLNCP